DQCLERFDPAGVVGDHVRDSGFARLAFDHCPDRPRDVFRDLLQRLLLLAARNGPVRPGPHQQVTDRLLLVRAGDQRNADREQAVRGFADVVLIVLREYRSAPRLDLLDAEPAGAEHAAVHDHPAAYRTYAAIDLGEDFLEHFAERRCLAHVADVPRQVFAQQKQVFLEPPLGPTLNALLDRVHHDRRQSRGEDYRPLVVGVSRIIIDDLLQRIAGAGEDGGYSDRDHRDVDGAADHNLGVVQPVAQEGDQQPDLEDEGGKREADSGRHFDQQLVSEAVGRPFEIIADDRDTSEHGVSADPEQGPADLLALLARVRLAQAANHRQHADDHETDEIALVDLPMEEHEQREAGDQADDAPRQIAVREQQDAGEEQDVPEIVHRDVDGPRDAHDREEYRRRLLGRDVQEHRERQQRADDVARIAAVEEPGGPQQERVEEHLEQVDEAQPAGRDPDLLGACVDMMFAGGDGNVPDVTIRIADGQGDLRLVGSKKDVAHRDIGWIVGVGRERFLIDRHDLGKRKAVDCDDVVAGDDSGGLRLRADGEADQSRVAR